jgi:hypothetical protein
MTFAIEEYLLGTVDVFLLIPVLVLAWTQVTHPGHRATAADLALHCRDFPATPLAQRWRVAQEIAEPDPSP